MNNGVDSAFFDPEAELNKENDVDLDTQRTPLPASQEGDPGYVATLGRPEIVIVETKRGPIKKANIRLTVDSGSIPTEAGLNQAIVRAQFWIDEDPDGKLSSGRNKNTKLGQMIDAVGLKGRKWKWADLEGKSCRIFIYHEAGRDGTPMEAVRSYRSL